MTADCLNCACECDINESFCAVCIAAIQSVECFDCGAEFRTDTLSSICDECVSTRNDNRAHT